MKTAFADFDLPNLTVRVRCVPEHAPVHLLKCEPLSATAVSFTTLPIANVPAQSGTQSIFGAVIRPLPCFETRSVTGVPTSERAE